MAGVSQSYITQELLDEYCGYIIEGMTTRQASKAIKKDPRNVFLWLEHRATDKQRQQYARALRLSADTLVAKGMEAAFEEGDVQRSRLKWDACRWEAGKRAGKYNDKLTLAGDAENPVKMDTTIKIVHVEANRGD